MTAEIADRMETCLACVLEHSYSHFMGVGDVWSFLSFRFLAACKDLALA
jgi:hypothetical protein